MTLQLEEPKLLIALKGGSGGVCACLFEKRELPWCYRLDGDGFWHREEGSCSASRLAAVESVPWPHSWRGARSCVKWNICAGWGWATQEHQRKWWVRAKGVPFCRGQRTPSANLTDCLWKCASCCGHGLGMLPKDCQSLCSPQTVTPCCSSTWAPVILPGRPGKYQTWH